MNMENMPQGAAGNSNKRKRMNPDNMSIADRFVTAMFSPGDYPVLLKLKAGKIVSFVGILVLLLTLIQYGIPMLAAIAGYGGVRNYILAELPQFSLENGIFTVDERMEREDDSAGIYILVDTSVDSFTKDDVDTDLLEAVLVSRSNMLMYNNVTGIGGIVQEQRFSDFGNARINNEIVAGWAPVIYVCMAAVFVMLYVITLVRYLGSALLYAFIMFMLSRIMTGKITFGTMYKIALFAQTVGALVLAVSNFIGTPVFMMAGSTFAMIVTVLIMNRAFFKIVPPPRAS
ncbi:MAG: DUF1189 domain-containing protein [Lachnospiraceae bacterium]|nr:DUF1189 domain-containing protein [Lachnospiraceae bacterium]